MPSGGGGGQVRVIGRSGERLGEMFQHLQHANMAPNFDHHQFGSQMMNPLFSDNISSQSTVDQNVQGIMDHLSMLQDRIQQLQALVPLISQNAHCQSEGNVVAQQQAASAAVVSIISQLAMVAVGLLPQSFENSGGQVPQPTDLPLNQLLQATVGPESNFFQQDTVEAQLRPPQRGTSLGTSTGNSFGSSGGAVSGVGVGANAGVPSDSCGLRFSSGAGGFPGMNNDGDILGQQNPNGQQAGGNNSSGAMLHNQMGGGVGKNFGSAGGGGKRRRVGNGDSPIAAIMLDTSLAAGANNFISHELGGIGAGLENPNNDSRSDDDSDGDGDGDGEGDNISPGSFDLVEMDASEILAEHTHFCEICGKGFKRDANLRMHMRGHGDEYKTPAALARPDKDSPDTSMARLRRYSCPCVGCKRNKKHRKFQPLKTMLCVKNHYRRSHCPKVLTCQKCMVKKFSVVADLKTHEKHCGRDKWQCSCGTTFSRKDKLFGHIGLFAGHTPVMPVHELEGGSGGGGNAVVENQGSPNSGSFGSDKTARRFWD